MYCVYVARYEFEPSRGSVASIAQYWLVPDVFQYLRELRLALGTDTNKHLANERMTNIY